MGLAGALRVYGANQLGVVGVVSAGMTDESSAASKFGAERCGSGRAFDTEAQSGVARQLVSTVIGHLDTLTG